MVSQPKLMMLGTIENLPPDIMGKALAVAQIKDAE
jgi:hypothetical protein